MNRTWFEEKWFEYVKIFDPTTGRWYFPYDLIKEILQGLILGLDKQISFGHKVNVRPESLAVIPCKLMLTWVLRMKSPQKVKEFLSDAVEFYHECEFIGDLLYNFAKENLDKMCEIFNEIIRQYINIAPLQDTKDLKIAIEYLLNAGYGENEIDYIVDGDLVYRIVRRVGNDIIVWELLRGE